MPDLRELASDPRFKDLSPDAKKIVVSRVSASDKEFSSLSKDAQKVVLGRLLGPPDKGAEHLRAQSRVAFPGPTGLPETSGGMGGVVGGTAMGLLGGTGGFLSHYAGKAANIVGLKKVGDFFTEAEKDIDLAREDVRTQSSGAAIADTLGETIGNIAVFAGAGKAVKATGLSMGAVSDLGPISDAFLKNIMGASALKMVDIFGTTDKKERQAVIDSAPWDILSQGALATVHHLGSKLGDIASVAKARRTISEVAHVPIEEAPRVAEASVSTGAPVSVRLKAAQEHGRAAAYVVRTEENISRVQKAAEMIPKEPVTVPPSFGKPIYDTQEKIDAQKAQLENILKMAQSEHRAALIEFEKSSAYVKEVNGTPIESPVSQKLPSRIRKVAEAGGRTQATSDEMAQAISKKAMDIDKSEEEAARRFLGIQEEARALRSKVKVVKSEKVERGPQSETPKRSYDEVQDEIDKVEERLGPDADTPELKKLYEERDSIGARELDEARTSLMGRAKDAGLNEKEASRVLADAYSVGKKSDVFEQYQASEYTEKLATRPMKEQAERVYSILADERGIPMDSMGDAFKDKKTTGDSLRLVRSINDYFRPRDLPVRGEIGPLSEQPGVSSIERMRNARKSMKDTIKDVAEKDPCLMS